MEVRLFGACAAIIPSKPKKKIVHNFLLSGRLAACQPILNPSLSEDVNTADF